MMQAIEKLGLNNESSATLPLKTDAGFRIAYRVIEFG